jgi:hypothetical protein
MLFIGAGAQPDAPAVLVHNLLANPEVQAGAEGTLGGKERFKEVLP